MKKIALVVLPAIMSCLPLHGARSVQELMAGYRSTPASEKRGFVQGLSEDEWRAMAEYAIGVCATNRVACREIRPNPISAIGNPYSNTPAAAALAGEYDAKFAAAGAQTNPLFFMFTFPKCCANFLSDTNNTEALDTVAYGLSVKRKYGTCVVRDKCTLSESINMCAEFIPSLCHEEDCGFLERRKNDMCRNAARLVKRTLRAQGKSFVAHDGVNPLEAPMAEFTAALNAPKFHGMGRWVEKWSPGHVWVEPKWRDDAYIAKLKESVLMGDLELKGRTAVTLSVHLGTKAYNQFVDEYNNGTSK